MGRGGAGRGVQVLSHTPTPPPLDPPPQHTHMIGGIETAKCHLLTELERQHRVGRVLEKACVTASGGAAGLRMATILVLFVISWGWGGKPCG